MTGSCKTVLRHRLKVHFRQIESKYKIKTARVCCGRLAVKESTRKRLPTRNHLIRLAELREHQRYSATNRLQSTVGSMAGRQGLCSTSCGFSPCVCQRLAFFPSKMAPGETKIPWQGGHSHPLLDPSDWRPKSQAESRPGFARLRQESCSWSE